MNEPKLNLPTISGDDLLLNSLSNKIRRGEELNPIESTMAIVSSKSVEGNRYGPLPSEMEAGETIIPEQVKAMIFSAIG